MKNFRPSTLGGDGFVYTTAEQGNVIAVRVYHVKTDNTARSDAHLALTLRQ